MPDFGYFHLLLENIIEKLFVFFSGMVTTTGFQTLLNYPDDFKFDVVLYDYTCGPCLLPFLHKFGYPPLVGVTAFNNPPGTIDLVGGHLYLAYSPFYSLYLDDNMNFWERAYNAYVHVLDSL